MASKLEFAEKVQEFCTFVIDGAIKGIDAREVYNDRGYYPSGSDEISDNDIDSLGITAANLEAAMQFFENILKMLNNTAITTADYRNSLNQMRVDL